MQMVFMQKNQKMQTKTQTCKLTHQQMQKQMQKCKKQLPIIQKQICKNTSTNAKTNQTNTNNISAKAKQKINKCKTNTKNAKTTQQI